MRVAVPQPSATMSNLIDATGITANILNKRRRHSKRRKPSKILQSLNHTRLATQRIRSLFGERKLKRLVLDDVVGLFASKGSVSAVLQHIRALDAHDRRIKGPPDSEAHSLVIARSQLQVIAEKHRVVRSQWDVLRRAQVRASAHIREAEARVMFWHDELRSVRYTHWCMQQVEYAVGTGSRDEEDNDDDHETDSDSDRDSSHSVDRHQGGGALKTHKRRKGLFDPELGHQQKAYTDRELKLARKEELMLQRGYVRSYITGKDPVFHKSEYLLEVIRKELENARAVVVLAHEANLEPIANEEALAAQVIATWWDLSRKHANVAMVTERWAARLEKLRTSKLQFSERATMKREDRASFVHQRWPIAARQLQQWWRRIQSRRARWLQEQLKRSSMTFTESMRDMLKKSQELKRWKCPICGAPKRTPYKTWEMVSDHLARHRDEERAKRKRKQMKDNAVVKQRVERAKREVEFIKSVKPGVVGRNGNIKSLSSVTSRPLQDGVPTKAKSSGGGGGGVATKSTVASERKRVPKNEKHHDGVLKKQSKRKPSHEQRETKPRAENDNTFTREDPSSGKATRAQLRTGRDESGAVRIRSKDQLSSDANSGTANKLPTADSLGDKMCDSNASQSVSKPGATTRPRNDLEQPSADLNKDQGQSKHAATEAKLAARPISTGARLIGTASRVALAALKARSRAAGARLEPKKKHIKIPDARGEDPTRIVFTSNKLPFSLTRKKKEKKSQILANMFAPNPMQLVAPGGNKAGNSTTGKIVPAIVWVDPSASCPPRRGNNNNSNNSRTKASANVAIPSTRLSDYLENLCELNPIYPRGAILLDQSTVTIGRSHCCSVTLDSKRYSKLLSKQHATISLRFGTWHPFGALTGLEQKRQQQQQQEATREETDDDERGVVAYITDNCSTNGTSLDGQPLESLKDVRLRDGAVITFGSCPKNPKQRSELVFRFMYLNTE
jgi:hypothetical protein